MSTIAVLLDIEEGHYLSTFGIAKGLRARGHTVCYLGLGGAEALVRQQGFDFIPILGETLTGTRMANLESATATGMTLALIDGRLDAALERLQPDALVLLSLHYLEALIVERRYGLPVVLLTPNYRSYVRARIIERRIGTQLSRMRPFAAQKVLAAIGSGSMRSFGDLVQLVLPIPELVLLPRAFDLPELAADPDVTYVGAGVDLARSEEPFPWDAVDSTRPLVYCTLGSQADLGPEVARPFFLCVIEAAAARPDLQFVLGVGRGFAPSEFPVRSANLYLAAWIPQLAVLRRAALMVSHAGAGTVKECILNGVPMVVLPMMNDQFACAERVVHHGLGVAGDLPNLTHGELLALIDRVAGEPAFRQRVAAMREHFLRDNDGWLGVRLVEAAVGRGGFRQTSNRMPSEAPRAELMTPSPAPRGIMRRNPPP